MKLLYALLVLVLVSSVGCSRTVYRIDLTPVGHELERRLTVDESVKSADGSHSDEVKRIGLLYPDDPNDSHTNVFVGRFHGAMPADVGGAGSYNHFATSLGSASIYSERFGGDDDMVRTMADHHAAIDELFVMLTDWVDYEIQDPAAAARIQGFLNGEVRTDFKNLCFYMWVASAADDEKTSGAQYFRMAQYLAERDYFSVDQLPALSRKIQKGDPEQIGELARSIVIRKLELSDGGGPAPASLALLSDQPKVEASMRKFLRGTDAYQKLVSKWTEEGKAIADNSPDPMQVLGESALRVITPFWGGNSSRVEVMLHMTEEPTVTNGTWIDEEKTMVWTRGLGGGSMPPYAFAAWATPDIAEQEKVFGRVVLSNGNLADYIRWYHSLSESETNQWEELLAKLDPESNNIDTLRSFQFEGSPDLAEPIVSVLIQQLEENE